MRNLQPPKLTLAPTQIRVGFPLWDVMTWLFAPDSVVVDSESVDQTTRRAGWGYVVQGAAKDRRVQHSDAVCENHCELSSA
jgi:hypothetical protein